MLLRFTMWIQRGSYSALLVMMLAALVVSPFSAEDSWVRWLLGVSLLGVTISALIACWRRGRTRVFVVALILGLLAVIVDVVQHSVPAAYPYESALRLLFMSVVTYAIFMDLMKCERVTMDSVLGAACVYMLMGLVWSSSFALLSWFDPTSFDLGGLLAEPFDPRSVDGALMYYSYVTLTTVGYGDITPVTPPARVLSVVEGILAQLYLAIIVARLVSLEISHRLTGRSE